MLCEKTTIFNASAQNNSRHSQSLNIWRDTSLCPACPSFVSYWCDAEATISGFQKQLMWKHQLSWVHSLVAAHWSLLTCWLMSWSWVLASPSCMHTSSWVALAMDTSPWSSRADFPRKPKLVVDLLNTKLISWLGIPIARIAREEAWLHWPGQLGETCLLYVWNQRCSCEPALISMPLHHGRLRNTCWMSVVVVSLSIGIT